MALRRIGLGMRKLGALLLRLPTFPAEFETPIILVLIIAAIVAVLWWVYR